MGKTRKLRIRDADAPKKKQHPNSLKNLELAPKFQPGHSGNPKGRPKRPISERYWDLTEEVIPARLHKLLANKFGIRLAKGATFGQAVAVRIFLQALGLKVDTGAARSAKEIREAIEGKAPQRIEISGPEKRQISISVKFDRKKT